MIQIKKDRSYGVIPLRHVEGEGWETLIVQHLSGHWSFPKGHPEGGEQPKQAAQRELYEETGLEVVRFLPLETFEEHYSFFHKKQKIQKAVLYYPALVRGNVRRQEEEILALEWLSLQDSCARLTFPQAASFCTQLLEQLPLVPEQE